MPRFFNNSSMIVCGSSRCGKTMWVRKLLYNAQDMFVNGAPEKILYCYTTVQDELLEMEANISGFALHKGLPTREEINELTSPSAELMIVLDDMVHEVINSKLMSDMFFGGRHMNASIIFITQNCFEKGKFSKGINVNASYFVLFKNMRDRQQVTFLARQMFKNAGAFMEAYDDIMKKPYSYVVLDAHSSSDEKTRVRTNVFPEENMVVYDVN